MNNKLDRPLEDIIKEEKKLNRARGNRRGRGQGRGLGRNQFKQRGGRFQNKPNNSNRKFSGEKNIQGRRGLPRKYVAPRKADGNPQRGPPRNQNPPRNPRVLQTKSQFIRKSGYRVAPIQNLNSSFEEKRKRVLKVSGLHFDLSNNDLFVSLNFLRKPNSCFTDFLPNLTDSYTTLGYVQTVWATQEMQNCLWFARKITRKCNSRIWESWEC